jgi:hypothetical protein
MSMPDTSAHHSHRPSVRWVVPLTAVAIGIAYFVAGLLGGNLVFGVAGLLLMLATALVFVVAARRSETVAGLMDRKDERINAIDAGASLFAGMTVLVAVLVMFVVEIARGRDGSPYDVLAAIGGVSYVSSLVYLRFRR